MERGWESEKKSRMDLERMKRKLESEARMTGEQVMDLENDKDRLGEKVKKMDFEYSQLSTRKRLKNWPLVKGITLRSK